MHFVRSYFKLPVIGNKPILTCQNVHKKLRLTLKWITSSIGRKRIPFEIIPFIFQIKLKRFELALLVIGNEYFLKIFWIELLKIMNVCKHSEDTVLFHIISHMHFYCLQLRSKFHRSNTINNIHIISFCLPVVSQSNHNVKMWNGFSGNADYKPANTETKGAPTKSARCDARDVFCLVLALKTLTSLLSKFIAALALQYEVHIMNYKCTIATYFLQVKTHGAHRT